ncbi:hypothetical protein [Geodermatophilus sp. TF02-6]|uniref:hypothetical protein n=1 Tax=Geodermatophilus sp. TF02-6 TaxID=2250575 RepID=UPI0018F3644D|nr:hypothetical protein [Geodermatophilus sp. TF02-6]
MTAGPAGPASLLARPAALDTCGAVVVAQEGAEQVVELAERIAARERDMVAAVRSGRSVVDVMHDSQFPSSRET